MSQRASNSNIVMNNADIFNVKYKKSKIPNTTTGNNRMVPMRNSKEASSKSKLTMQTAHVAPMVSRNKNMLINNPPPLQREKSAALSPNTNLIRKETYQHNAATVEVTVKAQKNPTNQGKPVLQSEPWGKVLKTQTQPNDSRPFNNFDPLRTVHFLSKELQLKLIQKMPTDYNLLQMLEDMQHALNRIPPDLLGVLKTQGFNDMKESDTASGITSESEYLRPQLLDKGVQTSKSFTLIASEKLHKHIEESSVKIEAACTQMEAVCTKLKAEKLELESLLRSEKDLVCKLKEEMSSLEIMSRAKEDEFAQIIRDLSNDKQSQEMEIKRLKALLDSQQTIANDDLKLLIHELRKKKSDAEREAMVSKHQLTLTCMENEKINALIATRERQINEMRGEMKQLQEVVNEQLVELQNIRCSTERSSVSTLTDANVWHPPEKESFKHNEDNVGDMTNVPMKSSSTCKVMVSGDTSLTSTGLKNVDYEGINVFLNKDLDEYAGDVAQFKEIASKFEKEYLLGSNTTTTSTPYKSSTNDPINIKKLIENVKEQALSLTTPVPPKRD